ncbi:MAG: hypothetical protein KAJ66_05565 [Candidatus Omnitrophica bacterium]|nr:hypothetical protein [Candidatus Omnitrophota bacterium]
MKKEDLKRALLNEKEKYESKTFDQLVKIDKPVTYECGSGKDWYQVEIQVLEKNDKYVHVVVSVDDGRLWRTILPLTSSFIVYKDK